LFDNIGELPIKSTLTLIADRRGVALKHCFALLVLGCGGRARGFATLGSLIL
jgi:hypothetical protein